MDRIDREICALVQTDAKRPAAAIAEAVGLPLSTTADRLKRLQASGAIRGWHAALDPTTLGAGLCAFVLIDMDYDGEAEATRALSARAEVQELHHVSGPHSYLVKLRLADMKALQAFLAEVVKPLHAVTGTETILALDTIEETATIAITSPGGRQGGHKVIWILLKGLAIGVAVAAPVGPIGLLCIKRTLDRGWATGVASGLGVAAADASYGVMVAAGLSATGLLLAYAMPMQAVGGLLIAFLGLRALRSGLRDTPSKAARGASGCGHIGAFASAYALTIANPMTILAFVGLVAGLGAAAASQPGAAYLLVAGVFAGSLLWWVLLVTATAFARTKVTPGVTRWLDLGSGAVLFIWGLWIAYSALASA